LSVPVVPSCKRPESVAKKWLKRLICPVPVGLVNSAVSMPIRVSKHSRASTVPVVIAILGMLVYWPLLSPSVMFFGRRSRVAGAASAITLFAH
jgi:hypothetical protein